MTQKILEDYADVTISNSNNNVCHKCNEPIRYNTPFLHLRRNRHVYRICGACLMLFGKKAMDIDPSLKEDVAIKILEHDAV